MGHDDHSSVAIFSVTFKITYQISPVSMALYTLIILVSRVCVSSSVPCRGAFLCAFLSARKADLKKGFQHLVLVVVVVVVVVGTRVKKRFYAAERDSV
jgi:membrane protein DedA with SNARE-associated domain